MSGKEQKVGVSWRMRQSRTVQGSCEANSTGHMQLFSTNAPWRRAVTIAAEIPITMPHTGQKASISTAVHQKAAMIHHHPRRSLA